MKVNVGEKVTIKELKVLQSIDNVEIRTIYFPMIEINGEMIMCRTQCKNKIEAKKEGENYLRELKIIQQKQEEKEKYGDILPVKFVTINRPIYGPTFDSSRE